MISRGFARCLAKISGDGNLSLKYLRYNNTCKELIEEFVRDMLKEFGPICITKGVGNSGTSFAQVNRRFVINRFLEHLPSFKSDFVYIPEVIKNNKSLQKDYLRALYDDEGCVSLRLYPKTKEWKRSISLTSNSLKLLEDVEEILKNNLGINTNKIIRNNPRSDYDKSYVLNITGKQNLIIFKERIGFKHPKKIDRMLLMLRSYGAQSKKREKFEKLKKDLYHLI